MTTVNEQYWEFRDNYIDVISECIKFNYPKREMSELIFSLLQIYANNNDGVIRTCGNGGSGTNASHFTQDIVKALRIDSVCLNDQVAFVNATANDKGYKYVFSDNLDISGKRNDILICFTGSGNSENIIDAIRVAKEKGMKVFCFVGFDGGKIMQYNSEGKDIWFMYIPLFDMRMVESCHNILFHYVIDCVEKEINKIWKGED